jgi:hypothetical protein
LTIGRWPHPRQTRGNVLTSPSLPGTRDCGMVSHLQADQVWAHVTRRVGGLRTGSHALSAGRIACAEAAQRHSLLYLSGSCRDALFCSTARPLSLSRGRFACCSPGMRASPAESQVSWWWWGNMVTHPQKRNSPTRQAVRLLHHGKIT